MNTRNDLEEILKKLAPMTTRAAGFPPSIDDDVQDPVRNLVATMRKDKEEAS